MLIFHVICIKITLLQNSMLSFLLPFLVLYLKYFFFILGVSSVSILLYVIIKWMNISVEILVPDISSKKSFLQITQEWFFYHLFGSVYDWLRHYYHRRPYLIYHMSKASNQYVFSHKSQLNDFTPVLVNLWRARAKLIGNALRCLNTNITLMRFLKSSDSLMIN